MNQISRLKKIQIKKVRTVKRVSTDIFFKKKRGYKQIFKKIRRLPSILNEQIILKRRRAKNAKLFYKGTKEQIQQIHEIQVSIVNLV